MTPDGRSERFHEIDAIFDAVLDLPQAFRASFLDSACGDDATLRRDILRLLAAHDRATHFLATPASELAGPLLEERDESEDADSRDA